METKLSVIIPVFNAEKYLPECMDSILGQTLSALEVICVDDCSTDGSAAVISEYAARDGRVSLLRNERNMHAGLCRNRGLETAEGEYVLFMDADDILLPGSLEKLVGEAEKLKADVLRCRAVDLDNVTGRRSRGVQNYLRRVPFFLFGAPVSFDRWYRLFPKLNAAPWGGICRREFLVENGIHFNDLICVNDRSFYWETVLKAKRIAFSKTDLLLYRMNMNSSLVGGRIRNFECHFFSYKIVNKFTKSLPASVRGSILSAELLDIANWFEVGSGTEFGDKLTQITRDFIAAENIDLHELIGPVKIHKFKAFYKYIYCTGDKRGK